MRFCVSGRLVMQLLVTLALAFSAVSCAAQETSTETVVLPQLVVDPPSASVGSEVMVLGSGLVTDDVIQVRILMGEDVPVGVTDLIVPRPEVNENGAFGGKLTLKSFVPGAYTVELLVDHELVATAPLSVVE